MIDKWYLVYFGGIMYIVSAAIILYYTYFYSELRKLHAGFSRNIVVYIVLFVVGGIMLLKVYMC